MKLLLIFLFVTLWFSVGILSIRNMDELTGDSELESMPLLWRLLIIALAPIGFLIFERHLLFEKAEPKKDVSKA